MCRHTEERQKDHCPPKWIGTREACKIKYSEHKRTRAWCLENKLDTTQDRKKFCKIAKEAVKWTEAENSLYSSEVFLSSFPRIWTPSWIPKCCSLWELHICKIPSFCLLHISVADLYVCVGSSSTLHVLITFSGWLVGIWVNEPADETWHLIYIQSI